MKRIAIYIGKMMGNSNVPDAPRPTSALLAGLGASLAIAITAGLSSVTDTPWLMAPFGASCFLAFAVPESPLAQPRNIVFGHLISTAVGLAVMSLLGITWWTMALAVGLAVLMMLITRTGHPPAGADPLLVMISAPPLSFLAFPTLTGSIAIALTAVLFNNLRPGLRYPKFW